MKIGILGTAPALIKAPFKDESWELWAVPGCYGDTEEKEFRNSRLKRVYELHSHENMVISCEKRKGFIEFAKGLKENFILRGPHPSYPGARIYDKDKFVNLHGRAPFSCSVSWMLAEAIEILENEEEKIIGFWGVNMAHDTEYAYQKPGVRELIGFARAKGITIIVEEGSELMSVPCLYGFEDIPPAFKIIRARTEELTAKKSLHQHNHEVHTQTVNYMNGALREIEFLKTRPDDEKILEREKLLEADRKEAQEKASEELTKFNVLHGALEEHQWVQNNFFNAG